MKLSELQELLEILKNKFGDLEIVRYYVEDDTEKPFCRENFSATEDDYTGMFENIRFWV